MTKAEENEYKIIAKRYANAILEFADDSFKKEDILSELTDVQTSINNSEDMKRVMESPIVSNEEKKKLLDKVFAESGINKIVLKFLKLLVDKKRFYIYNTIVKECKSEINKEKNKLDLKITSAIELTNSEKAMIKVKIEKTLNKETDLEWGVNKEIIGGLVFETNDDIIDCSLLHKLQTIKKEMIK